MHAIFTVQSQCALFNAIQFLKNSGKPGRSGYFYLGTRRTGYVINQIYIRVDPKSLRWAGIYLNSDPSLISNNLISYIPQKQLLSIQSKLVIIFKRNASYLFKARSDYHTNTIPRRKELTICHNANSNWARYYCKQCKLIL